MCCGGPLGGGRSDNWLIGQISRKSCGASAENHSSSARSLERADLRLLVIGSQPERQNCRTGADNGGQSAQLSGQLAATTRFLRAGGKAKMATRGDVLGGFCFGRRKIAG